MTGNKGWWLCCAVWALLHLYPPSAAALEPVALSAHKHRHDLGQHLEILEDADQRWSIKDVSSATLANRFKPSEKDVPNFGFTKSVYWFRCALRSTMDRDRKWLLELGYPLLDHVDLYIEQPDGAFIHKRAGDRIAFGQREVLHRNPVFLYHSPTGRTQRIFLRIETSSALILPLTLWSETAFRTKDHTEQVVYGLIFGIMFCMVLYNIFVYFSVRDRAFLWYVSHILSFGLWAMALSGLAFEHLWPNAIWWANVSIPLLIAPATAGALLFSREFLNTKQSAPRVDMVLLLLTAFCGAAVIFALLASYRFSIQFSVILSMAGVTTMLFAGIVCLKEGYKPARFYMAAWAVFIVGVMLRAFEAFGLLPGGFITENALYIGCVLEVIFLALALADRIKTIKEEKEQAQERSLEVQRRAAENLQREVESQTLALREKNVQLQELDRQKTNFFQNISHELRTPLTVLLTPLSSLLASSIREQPEEAVKKKLQAMERNTHRLLRLVNQLLDMSRLESGASRTIYEKRDVRKLAQSAVDGFAPFARSKSLHLELRGPQKLPEAYVDPEKLDKVLCNLVSNACKFTEPGGSVVVRMAADDIRMTIAVRDTGIGISEADLPKIFERFRQVDDGTARRYEGSGIGLSLAKELMEMTGGTLEVESEPNVGSTFTVTLPLGTSHIPNPDMIRKPDEARIEGATQADAAAMALAAEVTVGPSTEDESKLNEHEAADNDAMEGIEGHPQVLVIEDSPDMLELVADICSTEFEVLRATDGRKGLAMIQEHKPALVISDIMMPKMDGLELLRRVRSDSVTASIPVILLTAKASPELQLEGLEEGAVDYITKPFNPRELLVRTRNLVRLHQQERELAAINATLQQKVVRQAATLERSKMLGRYLPRTVVKSVIKGTVPMETVQERRRLTVFRCELRGFDAVVHVSIPENLAAMLNGYLSEMMEVAHAHGATVDVFVRDTVLGFFGAPTSRGTMEDAIRCAKMATEMWQRAVDVCKRWQDIMDETPPLPTMILASGFATVGNFGSTSRLEYTAVGGPVDEARDLLASVGTGELACSQSTWSLIQKKIKGEPCGVASVQHRARSVKLYRLAGPPEGMALSEIGLGHDTLVTPTVTPRPTPTPTPTPSTPSETPSSEHHDPVTDSMIKTGTLLAKRYEIQRKIGEGGMGTIYLAQDRKLKTEVALKLLRADFSATPARRSKLYREVKLARLVSHPNVARIFDLGEWGSREFISMEYISGHTLAQRIKSDGAIPIDFGFRVILQLCDGMAAAHAVGIVHRDLKPSNIMLTDGGRAVIMDFGVARWSSSMQRTGTETRGGIGTPHYMAPEQFEGGPVDHRVDIYALGVVAFEALTGKKPFEAESAVGIAYKHTHTAPPDPLQLNPLIPPRLAAVILECLEKNPANRIGSVSDISAMLETAVLSSEEEESPGAKS